MKKIKELQKRSKLCEGRSFGIGFTILNKDKSKFKFKTFLPFTACRDYLNDFSYVEYTKKEIGSIHGYNHKLKNCFNRKRVFYIGVNTLHYNKSGNWHYFDDCKKTLKNNYKNLQLFLNKFEELIGLKSKTTIKLDEDVLIFKAPIYWSKNTALISAYTLLIRCYFNISNEDLDLDLSLSLNNNKPFISDDSYMKKNCINFYNQLIKDKNVFDKIDYEKLNVKDKGCVHNFGIQGFLNKIKNE